jgi:uncharacterized protein (TIGR03083 family)
VSAPVPAPRRCGLAECDPGALGRDVLAAWDAFLAVVRDPSTDLTRPSRLPGWTGRDVCVHLGSWDDAQVLEGVLTSARTGTLDDLPTPDTANERLVRAHRDASVPEVVAALEAGRQAVADFFASAEAARLGRTLSRSAVGPLPVLSLVHAGTYELAVHALDLAPCGAPPPDGVLLDRGLAALVDVTAALAFRAGVHLPLTAMTTTGGWRFTTSGDGWATEPVRAGPFDGVGVRGAGADLLDASAGRSNLAQLLVTRRLQVQEITQWMRLAPLLEEVPGLPGGVALRSAVGALSGVAGGVGRVLGRFRR